MVTMSTVRDGRAVSQQHLLPHWPIPCSPRSAHMRTVSSSENEHRQGGPKRRNSQRGENKQTSQEAVHVGPDVCTDAPLYLGASKRLLKVAISNYIPAFPSFCFWVNSALISNDASRAKEYSTDESRSWLFWASQSDYRDTWEFQNCLVHTIQEAQYQITSQKCGV